MRFLSLNNRQDANGFTLVEMLIIAPVVILTIGGFVALMTVIIGDVLITRDHNALTYGTQEALDRIEQDTRLSTEFLTTTGTLLSPQGSNNNFTGTSAFTNTDSLILSAIATSKNPVDTTRSLIYYANQPSACGAAQSLNTILLTKIVYFIKDGSLWRRTVVPPYNTNAIVDANTVCNAPWQRNTCSPGYTPAAPCQTNDSKIMDNIDSLDVKYYLDPDSVTELGDSGASNATTIEVTINGEKTTAGRTVTSSGVLRVSKLN
jgi:hypothetical protein